ncbi:hypothetical protein G6F64_015444 [Rhizopus arrhizus]|uniref:Uncharacterized protein n=1 Tax=Rhizopus oryzae TaxID=64495 RepID=A0A9P6WRE1_RHIOR|nr:hypothetical protein G6F64_015444 [Rhizopus arrhizus]
MLKGDGHDLLREPDLDLPWPGTEVAGAVRADRPASRRRRGHRSRHEVLRAGRAGLGFPAVRHVDGLRLHGSPGPG